jgi:hypothetical protein
MVTIIMMTMLIAIMSDAFNHAKENIIKAQTKSLAELILDVELLMIWKRWGTTKHKHFIVFAEPSSRDE